MEVDGVSKAFLVSESAAAHLDRLDPTVDAFRVTVIDFQHYGIENPPEVIFDCGSTRIRVGHF